MKGHICVVLMIAMLAGCGGGGGESTAPAPTAPTVAGVAAAGSPLAGTVTLKDSSNAPKQLSASIAGDGAFSFNVSGLTAPFLLEASGTAEGIHYTFYSLAANAGNCNINPLTHLAVTMANGGQDIAGVFTTPTPAQIAAISGALPNAVAVIQGKLAPLFARVEAAPTNFITDPMKAYGQGIDLLFDLVSIVVSNGSVSIINKADGGIILSSTSIAGGGFSGNPDMNIMSSIYAITGWAVASKHGNVVSVWTGTPGMPIISVQADAQDNYKILVPNGTYTICGPTDLDVLACTDVTVNSANVAGINFGYR